MRILTIILALAIAIAAPGCRAGAASRRVEQAFAPTAGQAVVIELGGGSVSITAWEQSDLLIRGGVFAGPGGRIFAATTPQELRLRPAGPDAPQPADRPPRAELEILVPQGITLAVITFDAAVKISGFSGGLTVNSVAGDVTAQAVSGRLALRSGRGDVLAGDCSGEMRLVGEHGVLTAENSHGTIGMSTIMGALHYRGTPAAGDQVHLEVDHGPVRIDLGPGADASIEVSTNSGDVRCPPELESGLRSCRGSLGGGAASVTVRSVSGDVTVGRSP